jgi:hypothetical protein
MRRSRGPACGDATRNQAEVLPTAGRSVGDGGSEEAP